MSKKNLTGLVSGIILIILLVVFFYFISTTTNKSSSNYEVLKDYMNPDTIQTTLKIITDCEVKNYNIERDESLDDLDGDNTIGFRLKSANYNVIMYIKNNTLYSIRYADTDLYRNNTILKKINELT